MNRGFGAVVLAFLIWGLLPVYLKWLSSVGAGQIVAHRLVWCCVTALLWLAATRRLDSVRRALADAGLRRRLAASAGLIGLNWLLYVWAVTHDHIIDASLGYFINPLVNVLLGVALLNERLTPAQWIAVALAGIGVLWLAVQAGAPPWIGLGLALAFSAYGFIRKTAAIDAIPGLATETLLILPLGVGYLLYVEFVGQGAFGHRGPLLALLLIGAGVVTAVPLMLFAHGARQIRYSTVGLIQYLQPTLQLLLGIYVFHESFSRGRLIGFSLIWLALGLYTVDGLRRSRYRPLVANRR